MVVGLLGHLGPLAIQIVYTCVVEHVTTQAQLMVEDTVLEATLTRPTVQMEDAEVSVETLLWAFVVIAVTV